MNATTLILVRHAATKSNSQRPYILQGRSVDLELDELGHKQADAVGRALADLPVAAVFASPLLRARKTAEAIALPHRLPVETVDAIIETDVGVWEGLGWDAIRERWPAEFAAFERDCSTAPYLGGEHFSAVAQRSAPALDSLANRFPGQTIVAVGHNVVNRSVLALWLGIPLQFARKIPQNNGGFNLIDFHEGKRKVLTINNVAHLSGLLPPD